MFGDKPKCMNCGKEIEGNEEVYIKMKWPKRKGITEIKAYLTYEAKFLCLDCFEQKDYK
jgi:phage FluMu protein Com